METKDGKKYKLAVYIGRFQPFHNGHLNVVKQALSIADRVLILVGSSNSARTVRNPFTYEERREMIASSLISEGFPIEFNVMPIEDCLYNDTSWKRKVHERVLHVCIDRDIKPSEVCLIGYHKDSSSYYLDKLPSYDYIEAENFDPEQWDGTKIREEIYRSRNSNWRVHVPESAFDYIMGTSMSGLSRVWEDWELRKDITYAWKSLPYTPTFNTVDAVVSALGYVLLVRRGKSPGKGLLALPGGHLEVSETLLNGCLRELKEETQISLSDEVLLRSLRDSHTFDDPHRSCVGRYITHASYFQISDRDLPGWDLPKVQGGDDAASADWHQIDTLDPTEFHDDHYHIISYFLKGRS